MRGLVLLAAACASPPASSEHRLEVYLADVAALPAEARLREVQSWQLDEAAWNRTVAEAYRPLFAEYQRAFAAEAQAITALPARVHARRHWAGDPKLSREQARLRWALPVLAPSLVADPIDTVFVDDGGHWRALLGLDSALLGRVARTDPRCAEALTFAGPRGRCSDVGAAIADAALRTQPDRMAHLCRLAETLCGKEAP